MVAETALPHVVPQGIETGATPRPRGRTRRAVAAGVAFMHLVTGCYVYAPATTAPSPGTAIGFEVTDAGRVALAERFGPGVTRIEGRVAEATADEYAVNVSAVSQIGVGRSRWSGELVRLRRDYVSRSETRTLSRGRTAIAVGAAIVGFAAIVAGVSLAANGGDSKTGGGTNEGGGT